MISNYMQTHCMDSCVFVVHIIPARAMIFLTLSAFVSSLETIVYYEMLPSLMLASPDGLGLDVQSEYISVAVFTVIILAVVRALTLPSLIVRTMSCGSLVTSVRACGDVPVHSVSLSRTLPSFSPLLLSPSMSLFLPLSTSASPCHCGASLLASSFTSVSPSPAGSRGW
jgi:hypothetical protein